MFEKKIPMIALQMLFLVLVVLVWNRSDAAHPQDLGLTEIEREWIAAHPVISLAIDNTYPPLNYIDEEGRLTGLSVDYIEAIAAKLNITIDFAGSIWSIAIRRALNHEVSGIVNADATEERKPYLNFTKPYAIYPCGLVTLKTAPEIEEIGDLADKVICVKSNSSHMALVKSKSRAKTCTIETLEEGLEQVIRGNSFGVFDDVSVLGYLISKYNFANLKINFIHYDDVVGIARIGLRNDDPILLDVFDKAILSLTPEEKRQLQSKWLPLLVEERTVVEKEVDWVRLIRIISPVIFFLLIVYILILLHNKRLKVMVKRSTADLLRSEEQFRTLYENVPVGIFRTRTDGAILSANPALVRIFGYTDETDIKTFSTFDVYAAPQDRDYVLAELGNRGAIENLEMQFRRKDGALFWAEISARRIPVDAGEADYVDGMLMDITARKRVEEEKRKLERQLIQAQKIESLGTLAGGIAHDFNNILSAVIGFSDLALEVLKGEGAVKRYIEQIMVAGNRAKELVQQILLFSRQGEQELKPVRIEAVIREVIRLLKATLPATIEIRIDLSADKDLVLADPGQIHQILMNLCTNSAHAMNRDGGILTLSLDPIDIDSDSQGVLPDLKPGPYLKLLVSDTGHGIPKEIIGRIFDPFFSTKPRGEGTGLGLAVVHGIVKNLGGTIKVYSEPEKGTAIHLFFPLLLSEAEAEIQEAKAVPGGSERILFVDDEPPLIEIGKTNLESLGYRVTSVTDPLAAWDLFQKRPQGFDLLITDKNMPRMTGFALSEKILSIRPEMPIILCTGFSDETTAERAMALGIRDLLYKPIIKKQLADAVRRILDAPDHLFKSEREQEVKDGDHSKEN